MTGIAKFEDSAKAVQAVRTARPAELRSSAVALSLSPISSSPFRSLRPGDPAKHGPERRGKGTEREEATATIGDG